MSKQAKADNRGYTLSFGGPRRKRHHMPFANICGTDDDQLHSSLAVF
jgi:hypothetical protein